MEDLTVQHLWEMAQYAPKTSLKAPKKPSVRMRAALVEIFGDAASWTSMETSMAAVVRSRIVQSGDAALYRVSPTEVAVGRVWFHARVGELAYTCVSRWGFVARPSNKLVRYAVRDLPFVVSSDDLLESAVHTTASAGDVSQVIVPVLHRAHIFA